MKFKLNWSVCRVCLKEGEELTTIFARDENEILIADKIMECGGITIARDINLPQEICNKCSAFLSVAYKFRVTCKNSDEVLRSFADKRVESDVEDVKDEEVARPDDENQEQRHEENSRGNLSEEEIDLQNHTETVSVFVDPPGDLLDTVYENEYPGFDIDRDDDNDEDDDDDDDEDNDSTYKPPFKLEKSYASDHSDDQKKFKKEERDDDFDVKPRRKRGRPKKTDPPREKPAKVGKGRPRGPRKQKEASKTLAMDTDGTPVIKFEKPQHICDVCGNVYKMRYSLDNHMRWHRKEKPYDCEICGTAFGLNSQLTRHMRTHTGQKPYECQYCGRRFSDLGTKNKHERTHTGERPYKCETCGKTFTYSHVLSAHKLTHTGEKRYSCDECGKRFTRAHHLKAHLSTLIHQKPSVDRQASSATSQSSSSVDMKLPILPPTTNAVLVTTTTPVMAAGAEAMAIATAATTVAATVATDQTPDIKVQILPGQILSNSNDSHSSNPGNPAANLDGRHPLPLFLF